MNQAEERTKPYQAELNGEIDYTRQRDWLDPSQVKDRVIVAGNGGIGSPLAICLAKMGMPYLTLIDFDEVETHNIPNQMYRLGSEGQSKPEALAEMCLEFGTIDVTALVGKVQEFKDQLQGVVCTGFDSMVPRHETWEMVKLNPNVRYLVDGRIGGQDIVVYTIDPLNPAHIKYYEENALFSDEEGVEAPCTARAVMDVGFITAGIMARQVRTIMARGFLPNDKKDKLVVPHTVAWNQEAMWVQTADKLD